MTVRRNARDDDTVCIGRWRFQVTQGIAYIHHADHPGDIHLKAGTENFFISVLDDEVLNEKATLAVPFVDLGPMTGKAPPELWDNQQALREGWDLFDVDGRLQLQRIDSPSDLSDTVPEIDYDEPKFASDADAVIHVATQAAAGSSYHRAAVVLIGTWVGD